MGPKSGGMVRNLAMESAYPKSSGLWTNIGATNTLIDAGAALTFDPIRAL